MIRELPLGVYVPGKTWVHRANPAAKFCALVIFILAITFLPTQPWHATAGFVAVLMFYAAARIPAGLAWRQLFPVPVSYTHLTLPTKA